MARDDDQTLMRVCKRRRERRTRREENKVLLNLNSERLTRTKSSQLESDSSAERRSKKPVATCCPSPSLSCSSSCDISECMVHAWCTPATILRTSCWHPPPTRFRTSRQALLSAAISRRCNCHRTMVSDEVYFLGHQSSDSHSILPWN